MALQLILPKSLEEYGKERLIFPKTQIKYTDDIYPAEYAVCDDYVYILSKSDKPYAMMYKDKNFAKTLSMIFDKFWKENCKDTPD
jgi:hypothetical protein